MSHRFEALTDDPSWLIDLAINQAKESKKEKNNVKLRQAAELGWLAASSLVDVVTGKLQEEPALGFQGRLAIIRRLEKNAGLKSKTLTAPFTTAQAVLHGQCFHGDKYEEADQIMFALDWVREMIPTALRACERVWRKR